MFYVQRLPMLIIARRFLGPLMGLFTIFGDVFDSSVGINMHKDADKLYALFDKYEKRVGDGDYAGFDLGCPSGIAWMACSVIYELFKLFGYTEEEQFIVRGILTDVIHPILVMNEALFSKPGIQPSGGYATAEINCLKNKCMIVYSWFSHPILRWYDIEIHMLLRTYGDDFIYGISRICALWFNNHYYSKFCKDHYDMTVTAAQKGNEIAMFTPRSEWTFLKRSFVYHKKLGKIVGQLEYSSILRSFLYTLPSDKVSQKEQMIQVCSSALREMFFYMGEGPEVFDRLRDRMIDAYLTVYEIPKDQHDLVYQALPTYYGIAERLTTQDKPVSVEKQVPPTDEVEQEVLQLEGALLNREDHSLFIKERFSTTQRERAVSQLQKLRTELDDMKYVEVLSDEQILAMRQSLLKHSNHDARKSVKKKIEKSLRKTALIASIIKFERIVSKLDRLPRVEGSVADMEVGPVTIEMKEGTVDHVMGESPDVSILGSFGFDGVMTSCPLELSQFLSRPRVIHEQSLQLDPNLDDIMINPWSLYFSSGTVRSKLRNYAFIRAKLIVEISISATPFAFGRELVSYIALANINANYNLWSSQTLPITEPKRLLYLSWLSQQIGAKSIDVKSNKPLRFECPFVSPSYCARLFNESVTVIPNTDPFTDIDDLGILIISTLNTIKTMESIPTNSPYLQVVAWLEDVKLGIPTGTQMLLTLEGKDEREVGPVEKISTALLPVSKVLESVPGIGIFAKASSMALNAIKGVSALFGWSYPVASRTEVFFNKMEPFQNGANVIGMDTGKRITVDPKQELTVDPRVFGLSEDELALEHICNKESLLWQVEWDSTSTPFIPIFESIVNPAVSPWRPGPLDPTDVLVQPTALAWASIPFEYWNGDMEYRLEIVCCKFARGKILVGFEPNVSQWSLLSGSLNLNTQQYMILDIQETNSVQLCIPWGTRQVWARVARLNYNPYMVNTSVINPQNYATFANGIFFIAPFTELQSPEPVTINVYVRGKKMQFNYYNMGHVPGTYLTLEGEVVNDTTSDNGISCYVLNDSHIDLTTSSQLCFGEKILSFRSLLKRFQATRRHLWEDPNESPVTVNVQTNIFPYTPLTSAGLSTAIYEVPLFAYLRFSFTCYRGGLRKRIRAVGITQALTNHIKITLDPPGQDYITPTITYDNPTGITSSRGTVTFVPSTNAGVEFELPFYTPNYFASAMMDDMFPYTVNRMFTPYGLETYTISIDTNKGTVSNAYIFEETAAGEDFTFGRWAGAPVCKVQLLG